MDIEEQEKGMEEGKENASASRKTFVVIIVCLFVTIGLIFAHFAFKLDTDPEKECIYRGGVWSSESKDCVFEDGVGGGVQRVGMTIPALTFTVPTIGKEVFFTDVEIGSSKEYSQPFSLEGGGVGSVVLINELARVQGVTNDLVLPFAVQTTGTGVFTYVGVFEKTDAGYVFRDSLFIGDRINPERLNLAQHEDEGVYGAQLMFRDRTKDEPMSTVPREPKTQEMTIQDHMITNSFAITREGIEFAHSIVLKDLEAHMPITSPLSIAGSAGDEWFSQGGIFITLLDDTSKVLARGVARAGRNISEAGTFATVIPFTVPEEKKGTTGYVRFSQQSSLDSKESSFEVPIVF